VPNFVSVATSIVELAHGKKLRTHSITHPAYLMAREPKRLHFGNKCAEWSRKDRLCYCNYLNREEHKGAFINQNKMLLHITADCAPNVNLTANKPASQRSSLTVMSTEKSDHSNQK